MQKGDDDKLYKNNATSPPDRVSCVEAEAHYWPLQNMQGLQSFRRSITDVSADLSKSNRLLGAHLSLDIYP